ncbi:MAG TPA: hypothetical protein ENH59_10760 [Bacteroidetes bacterium]|nr:hypothetical protein [Bacteroidota bacterium]
MKQAIRISLILIIFQAVILRGIPVNGHSVNQDNLISILLQKTDTINTNPYLKIRKFDLELITPSSGIQFFKDGILFSSLSKRNAKMIPKHISFGDRGLYYATLDDSVPVNPVPFKTDSELLIPAEGTTFTGDMSVAYISKLSGSDNRVKIYRAEAGTGDNPQSWHISGTPLSFCYDYNNYTHPTVSSDGKLMIFSSDMPGGSGEMDLYISRYESNVWTRPENMGVKFNSKGSELYACLDDASNLYFSSDGLPGLGGYDIFFSSFNGSGWDEPVNLYDQINTVNDEVAFKINREGANYGFYTMIERSGLAKKKLSRHLFKLELNDEYKKDESLLLSDVLKDYAVDPPILALYKEREETAGRPETEKVVKAGAEEKQRIADSLLAVQKETERLAKEQRLADSLLAVQLEAERLAEEKRVADSLRMEEIRQKEEEAARDAVIYRVQILASTIKGVEYNIRVKGKTHDTYEYYYKEAWRITVGEFTLLRDAVEFRKACREAGYEQAFVVAFKDGVRSLDPDLFR